MPQRAGDFAGGVFGVPRPVPQAHPLFDVGNDAVGDAGVDV